MHLMTKTEAYTQTRKYHFASLVADADEAACKAGKTFTLPLSAARELFKQATAKTQADYKAIARRQERRATRR